MKMNLFNIHAMNRRLRFADPLKNRRRIFLHRLRQRTLADQLKNGTQVSSVVMPMMVIVMMMLMHFHARTHAAHPLLHHLVDHNLKRINLQRLQLLVQLFHGNTQPHERPENHIPARPADTLKMQNTMIHSFPPKLRNKLS